jgi:uncharacterized DUF497 family protein
MYNGVVAFEWAPNKAAANVRKHGPIRMQRFVALGVGVVVYCHSGENIRIISARTAGRTEREQYEARR